MTERKFKKPDKKILILAGIFLLMIVIGCVRNLRQGIYIFDEFLVQKSENLYRSGKDEIRLIRAADGTTFELTFNGITKRATLVWSKSTKLFDLEHDYATITFDDGTVVEGTWFRDSQLLDQDRMPISWAMDDMISFSGVSEMTGFDAGGLAVLLCRLDHGDTEQNGTLYFVLLGALLYVIGVLNFLYPDMMHFMGSRWRYRNAELSDDGRLAEQVGGVVCMIVGFLAAINVAGLF